MHRKPLTLLLLLASALPVTVHAAAVQAWDDGDTLHFSNIDTREDASVSLDEPAAPLVSLVPAGAGTPGNPPITAARPEGGADISRLVAHDARTAERLRLFAPLVSRAAAEHGVNAALLHAVVAIESAYNPGARSRAGAIGLMQVMPATAARYGVFNLEDPLQNLHAGCLYLKDLLVMFHQNVNLAVAAYNAGENAVLRHGNQIPPYPETQRYVPQVVQIYRGLLQ